MICFRKGVLFISLFIGGTAGYAADVLSQQADAATASRGLRTLGDDWAQFLGPTRNGKSKETGLLAAWGPGGPSIVWQVELGTSYSAPSISQGRLFHFDRHGNQARLTCRNSETGREIWRCEHPTRYEDMLGYNNGPRCTPLVDGDRVYTLSAEGILQCVRVEDGAVVWRMDTNTEFHVVPNFFGVGSSPLMVGDVLVVNVGGSTEDGPQEITQGPLTGNGTGVVGFDKLTGKVLWRATNDLASYASPVAAEIDGKQVCFVFAREGLIALEPTQGHVWFEFPWRARKLESVNASSPVVVGNEVFISESYGPGSALLRIRGEAYEIVWSDRAKMHDKSMELHWNTPIEHEGYLYGSSGQHGGAAELRCVDWKTGKVQWRHVDSGRASLIYADGMLYCLAEDGNLRLLRANPEKYEEISQVTYQRESGRPLLSRPAWAAPVLSHGFLYIRGEHQLLCLDVLQAPASTAARN
jgi:outer membrane protein assembly factor BamB